MDEFLEESEETKETESMPESEPEPEPEKTQGSGSEPKEDSSDVSGNSLNVSKDTSDEKPSGSDTETSDKAIQSSDYMDKTEELDLKVIERIDALLDALSEENGIETLSEASIPISGYRDWNYGIVVKFKVYPYGAGYYMDSTVVCSEPEDFEAWYSRTSSLINDTIRDFYILSVTDDDGREVYNYETYVDPGDSSGEDITIPIDGYKDWNYEITVEYKVYPYGAGYYMNLLETCSDVKDFEEWYRHNASLINDTLKDFYILSVTDRDGIEVYNHEAYVDPGDGSGEDDPDKGNNSGEYLELLQDIYAELEAIKEADKESQLLTDEYRSEMLTLQTAETGSSIIICVALFIISAEIAFREVFARFK